MERVQMGQPSALGAVTGMVGGLGGERTPASGYVGPQGAILIGITSSIACFLAAYFIKKKLKIDDSLDVFPVHMVVRLRRHPIRFPFCIQHLGRSWL